jgi:hypothetical protein
VIEQLDLEITSLIIIGILVGIPLSFSVGGSPSMRLELFKQLFEMKCTKATFDVVRLKGERRNMECRLLFVQV